MAGLELELLSLTKKKSHGALGQLGAPPVRRGPSVALFARAGSPAAQLAGVPELVRTAPPSVFP